MSQPERAPPPDAAATAEAGQRPSLGRLLEVLTQPLAVRSLALTGLLLLAMFYTLYFARDVFMPIVAALVLQLILAPILRGLTRIHLPEPVGAAIIVIGLIGGLVYGGSYLAEPVTTWLQRMPQLAGDVEEKLATLREPVEEVVDASKEVEQLADVDSEEQEVVVKSSGFLEQVFGGLRLAAAHMIVVIIVLYFLLASGSLFKLKLVRVLPRLEDKKRAIAILRQIEHDVSTYLFTVTLINIGLGCAVGATMWAIGLPNAALWGVMAAFLNFMPFLGSIAGIVVVSLVAFISFDQLAHIALAPAAYLALTTLEGNFITPALLGRRLLINPVFLVVNIVFWAWLWGVPGALLAGPLLVILKALCDQVEPLAAIGEFLGGRET